jgi:hypothetical protein
MTGSLASTKPNASRAFDALDRAVNTHAIRRRPACG